MPWTRRQKTKTEKENKCVCETCGLRIGERKRKGSESESFRRLFVYVYVCVCVWGFKEREESEETNEKCLFVLLYFLLNRKHLLLFFSFTNPKLNRDPECHDRFGNPVCFLHNVEENINNKKILQS